MSTSHDDRVVEEPGKDFGENDENLEKVTDTMAASDPSKAAAPDAEENDEALREKMIKFMKDDPHMAKLKHEYLNIHHKARLETKYLPESAKLELEQKQAAENGQDGEPPKKKAKLSGRNKKRPNRRITDNRMCSFVATGKECRFGEKCRFSHDVEKYMSEKPPDLGPTCYMFDKFGYCSQGLHCRFASQHTTDDFKCVTNEDKAATNKPQTLNTASPDLRYHLRRREVFFPNADKYLESIGVKPKYGYRSGKMMKGASGNKCADKTLVKSDDTDRTLSVENSVTSEKDKDLTSVGGDAANQDAPPSEGADHQIHDSVGDNLKTIVSEEKLVGSVTDEDVINIRPGEKKTIDFRDKLYLAPLTTVGNLPFRRVCKNYGVDITCGEMALATNILQGQNSEWALLKRHVSEDLFGVQLCGGHPDTMTRCAELLNREIDVDFIDVNVGCPIDLIFKKGEGSALMGRQNKFEQIVRGMTSVLDVPLTVKIRTGIFHDKPTALNVVPKLRDWGASLVTLHGRSREQRYTKPADWDYITQCAEAAKPMPLFGNGDILSYEEYNARKQTGVSGIMVARGALIKPWIFTEIKEQRTWDISSTERLDMLKDFSNYGLEHWGSDTQGVETTRKFLLEWLSFLHRYIPVGVMDQLPQKINHRPPHYLGRNDLETLMASENCADWIKISEMLLGPVHDDFTFLPKHKANSYK